VQIQNSAFPVTDFTAFRYKMLNWANRFNIFCLLDNQLYTFTDPAFECILAVGCKKNIVLPAGNAFNELQQLYNQRQGWLFGHLGYDLKNETEQLASSHQDGVGFSDLHFFEPEYVVKLGKGSVEIMGAADALAIFTAINNCAESFSAKPTTPVAISTRFTKEEYMAAVQQLQRHIVRGDCYEINFCQEFYAEKVELDPLAIYKQLIELSPNPFAAMYKVNGRFCLCASPERYLKKEGHLLFSQPMKGTARRHLLDDLQDEASKQYLKDSAKEKSENVMVVDLVRNDLSRICKQGSVKASELFGVYSFPQVHQMISTVSGELTGDELFTDIIRATFPMGSMTGAPKKRVMELIEQYERSRRGLFSGAIGYIDPHGDFDFNVVIRSMFYNQTTGYLSFQAGSAITFYSDAEQEYEECMLKAGAMLKVLA
jgi:para-aminobenzoate synthetase component I